VTLEIRRLSRAELDGIADSLGAILVDAVASGGGVSFMHPLAQEEAAAFFHGLSEDVGQGRLIVLAAFLEATPVGSVQVAPAWQPNQPHRVDLAKMIVHRNARGRGIGGALLAEAEAQARALGRTLITLDTVTDGPGHRLYLRHGYIEAGHIPDYALGPFGTPDSATFMVKTLA